MIIMLLVFIICIQFMFHVNFAQTDLKLFPNLPFGDYVVDHKAIMVCKRNEEYPLQHNLYLTKSNNISVMKGNLTFKIHYDDSVKFHTRLAMKESNGDWKENVVSYSATTGCTAFKFLLGAYWDDFVKSFHFDSNKCPISAGVYKTNGWELPTIFTKSNFPTKFYYGTYRIQIHYFDRFKKEVGCIILVAEVKRP